MKSVSVCFFDVGHERGEILDPCIVSIAIVVVGVICAIRVPIEKIDRVWVWFVRDVIRVSSFPFIVPEGEEVDAEFEFVFDGRYLVVFDMVFDCIEAFIGEEGIQQSRWLKLYIAKDTELRAAASSHR